MLCAYSLIILTTQTQNSKCKPWAYIPGGAYIKTDIWDILQGAHTEMEGLIFGVARYINPEMA